MLALLRLALILLILFWIWSLYVGAYNGVMAAFWWMRP
jgi:hypothetical protein